MKARIVTFAVFVGLFTAAYWIGAQTDVPEHEAEIFLEEFNKIIDGIDGFGIFAHNSSLALPMFIPGFGIIWGLFSAWSTGFAFSAIASVTPHLGHISPLYILYLSPFGIMELVAYSMATSRSFILIKTIIKRQSLRSLIKHTAIEVGILIGLLLAGGYLEFYLIELARQGDFELLPSS